MLDKLFQTHLLDKYNHISLLGGRATVIHHIKHKSQGLALRWYTPNGIPLTLEQHNQIHGKNKSIIEAEIFKNKNNDLKKKLIYQARTKLKLSQIRFEEVKNHIIGDAENYI